MSTMSMYDVPVEIVESVIDQLCDDLPALKSSSLVCRAWLPRARYWIVQEVAINLQSTDDLANFEASSPPLGLVRRLKINGKHSKSECLALKAPCWSKCKAVTSLQLQSFNSDNLSTCIIAFLKHFPCLRSLSIQDCELFFLCTLFHAIRALPQLRELKVTDLLWTTPGDHDHYIRDTVPKADFPLRHIVVNQVYDTEDFVDLMLKMEPNLRLWSIWTDDVDADLLVMQTCASTLQTVDLRDQGQ